MTIRVIAISGKAGSGKDTSAVIMADILQNRGRRVLITHYADLLKYICRQFFGWDGKKDEQGRQLLQIVGTDVIRKQDPNFWVDFLRDVLLFFEDRWDYVLIPDLRFPNELYELRNAGFDTIHIRIKRSGQFSVMPAYQQAHSSETAMDGEEPDYTIENDDDIWSLRDKIATLIEGGTI